ncbi:MAG TPA: hypothetical protein VLG40_03400 [Candidatus Saccharimonas sp.]|nr:hypothetical protein [Candidatus Saccharimonas sp.]
MSNDDTEVRSEISTALTRQTAEIANLRRLVRQLETDAAQSQLATPEQLAQAAALGIQF